MPKEAWPASLSGPGLGPFRAQDPGRGGAAEPHSILRPQCMSNPPRASPGFERARRSRFCPIRRSTERRRDSQRAPPPRGISSRISPPEFAAARTAYGPPTRRPARPCAQRLLVRGVKAQDSGGDRRSGKRWRACGVSADPARVGTSWGRGQAGSCRAGAMECRHGPTRGLAGAAVPFVSAGPGQREMMLSSNLRI